MAVLRRVHVSKPVVHLVLPRLVKLPVHLLPSKFGLVCLIGVILVALLRVVIRLRVGRILSEALPRSPQAVAFLWPMAPPVALNLSVLRSPQQLVTERAFLAQDGKQVTVTPSVAAPPLA